MIKIIFLTTVLFLSFSLQAQINKVTIYCVIDPAGRVNYNSLDKILPDSLQAKILLNPRKEYKLRDGYKVLLWMSLNDWKLVSTQSNNTTGSLYYTMSRDIFLDKKALDMYIENIKSKE